MELAARKFIRNVLTLHLALLLIVCLIVLAAARTVYNNTREQAMQQAQRMQELLAHQTARGVENYYASITAVLDLLKPTQEDEPTTQPGNSNQAAAGGGSGAPLGALLPFQPQALRPGPGERLGPGGAAERIAPGDRTPPGERPNPNDRPANPGRGGNNPNPRGQAAATMRTRVIEALWRQLQSRVSLLYVVDGRPPARNGATQPGNRLITRESFGEENGITGEAVTQKLGDWLEHIDTASVSDFEIINGQRCNVVAVPMRNVDVGKRILVAVVPLERLERELLTSVNARPDTGAMLVDSNGTVMSHSSPQVIGTNVLTDFNSGHSREVASKYLKVGAGGGTEVFRKPTTVNGVTLNPGMVTIEPVVFDQFGGKRWLVSIASGLDNINSVVTNLFREAFWWVVFVVISISAILASTSIQLIRGRLRIERLRHEMLERELTQAREIQMHWLPSQPYRSSHAAVAAVNRPASRISGDFYNWFDLPDGRTAVCIGDVTGHGMAAAFLMSTTQLLVRNTLLRLGEAGPCLEDVNRQLCTQVFNGQFVTMLLLVIDPDRRHIDLANAGHPAPLIGDETGFRVLNVEPQLVLGVDPDTEYPTQRIELDSVLKMLLFTDGVVDAANDSGKRFRVDGLLTSLSNGSAKNADSMLTAITQAVDSFRRGQDLSDDLTLVAIDFNPTAVGAMSVV